MDCGIMPVVPININTPKLSPDATVRIPVFADKPLKEKQKLKTNRSKISKQWGVGAPRQAAAS